MFFDAKDASATSTWEALQATRLHGACKRFKSSKKWYRTVWEREFRLLRHKLQQDTKRIEAVLDWYIKYLTTPALPDNTIRTAKGFCKHFLWLESQYLKTKTTNLPVGMLEEYLEVHEIKRLIWPEEVREQAREFIAQTLTNYLEYYERAHQLNKKEHKQNAFLVAEFWRHISRPIDFVPGWVRETHQIIYEWEDWSGSLKGFAFTVHSKRYVKMMLPFVERTTGRKQDWFLLLEMMGYVSAD